MSAKIIARTASEDEIFELCFPEGLTELQENTLTAFLEASGATIRKRKPDGIEAVWECQLPHGEIVNERTKEMAERGLQLARVGCN